MQKQIKISNQEIKYSLQTSHRAKRLRLAVYCDGSVVITKPRWVPNFILYQFVKTKSTWILNKIEHFRKKGFKKFVNSNENKKAEQAKYLTNKNQALILVKNKILEFNKIYNYKYHNISVRNQQSRWGSCSRKGNLNFNYKILFLPQHLADYIIVHELCHLKELNHSPRFWHLVSQTMPEYKKYKKDLRKEFEFSS